MADSIFPVEVVSEFVDSRDTLDRLCRLDPEAFAHVVGTLARAEWPDATHVQASPPSPERGVDVRVGRDDREPVLLHGRQFEPHNDLDAETVRALSAFPAMMLVATTGGVTSTARAAAAEAGVDLLDGPELLVRLRERGVELPDDTVKREVKETVDELAARWPSSLRETARDLASAVDDVTAFDRVVDRADQSTDLVFVREDPLVRLRFSEAGLLVYVRADEWQRVVAYPMSGSGCPPLSEARERVVDAIQARL